MMRVGRSAASAPSAASISASPHILVVDDDPGICTLLAKVLAKHGYRVTTARNAGEMRATLRVGVIDLVVLDVMLPGENGYELCRWLSERSPVPIIMLTAMREEPDRIVGLELGADDFIGKPFSARELVARIKAVLRRAGTQLRTVHAPPRGTLLFAGWTLDIVRRELKSPAGALVHLTSGEFDLLVAFADHPGRLLTREQLLDIARGRTAEIFDRSIDIQVSRLRRKIEDDPKEPAFIKTIRGAGYMFTPEVVAG